MPSAESGLLNQTFLANTVCEEVSAVLAAETPQYKVIRVIMAPPYNFDNASILASSKIHNDGKIFNPDESLRYLIAPAALNSSDGFCLTYVAFSRCIGKLHPTIKTVFGKSIKDFCSKSAVLI